MDQRYQLTAMANQIDGLEKSNQQLRQQLGAAKMRLANVENVNHFMQQVAACRAADIESSSALLVDVAAADLDACSAHFAALNQKAKDDNPTKPNTDDAKDKN